MPTACCHVHHWGLLRTGLHYLVPPLPVPKHNYAGASGLPCPICCPRHVCAPSGCLTKDPACLLPAPKCAIWGPKDSPTPPTTAYTHANYQGLKTGLPHLKQTSLLPNYTSWKPGDNPAMCTTAGICTHLPQV